MGFSGVHFKSKALAAQVVLLVLPLVVLSTIGFLSLKQDKALALHEATERAHAIADDLIGAFSVALKPTESPSETWPCSFVLNGSGEIVSPPPIAEPIPAQRFDESSLSNLQRSLWSVAQRLEIQGDHANAVDAWNRFLGENPPEAFAGIATFNLGVALEKTHQSAHAQEVFKSVADKYPDSPGESGLPLEPIARFKSIDWTTNEPAPELLSTVDVFGSNVVSHPSWISTTLLTEALQKATSAAIRTRIQNWLERWRQDDLSRAVAQSPDVKRQVTSNNWFWVTTSMSGPHDPANSASLTNVTSTDFNWLVVPSGPQYFDTSLIHDSHATLPLEALYSVTERMMARAHSLAASSPRRFSCQTQSQVERRLFDIVKAMRRIPDYMGVSVSVAGTRLNGPYPGIFLWHQVGYFGRKGGGVKKEYSPTVSSQSLATASLVDSSRNELLHVSVWLTSEETLYRNQRGRTFWLTAIIGVASLGAAIGLVVAWRGYSRQVQLNALKSNFVSSVSHELRAPIASVRLMAESLESGKLSEPDKRQEYYKYIGQECRRLSALIENVLDFARIEQGRKQYELEPTDVVALMRQTITLMKPYAAERQVTLNLTQEDRAWDSLHPVIDGRAIQQALVNLIDNAIKHSPAGSQVSVGLQCIGSKGNNNQPESNHSIEMWVEDKGPGIPLDQHEKIFERFYRLGSELRRETPGVGIGLSIVKHIVEAHGGKIRLRSSPGQGSRFSIDLPLEQNPTHNDLKS